MDIRIGIDDGRKEMIIVADLLDKYSLDGVFYIAPFEKKCTLSLNEIADLAQRHEVAGHTLTHCRLTTVSIEEARHEIEMGKEELEEIIGKPVTKFATPRGWHNPEIIELIKQAGYLEHRDTKMGITNREGYDDFHLPCSAHFYPRPEYQEKGIYQSIIDKFEEAKTGGYFNVLVHTDELERFKLWEDFERVLEYISLWENYGKLLEKSK